MATFTLEPCPSCGGKARLDYRKGRSAIGSPWHREYVACRCGMQTKIVKHPGGAVKLWNRRHLVVLPAPIPPTDTEVS